MRIETKNENRKAMVQAIAEFTGSEMHYMGPPTFNYTVGSLIIDRDGVITCEDDSGETELTGFLTENGYLDIPADELNIEVPMETSLTAVQNLLAMLHARAYLLNRITRRESFAVSDAALEAVRQLPEDSALETITAACGADSCAVKGVSFEEGKVTFTFPVSADLRRTGAMPSLPRRWQCRRRTPSG